MKTIVLVLSLCAVLSANTTQNTKKTLQLPANKLQLCSMYEESFLTSADIYEDTKSCYDLKYSILSFKQMLLSECPLDSEYIKVIWYLQKTHDMNCGE